MKTFDTSLRDSQATAISPISPAQFDFSAYESYEAALLPKNKAFFEGEGKLLVYRRMRAAEVFSAGCGDMENSLTLQLGALQAGMAFKADLANFLEPWYGIGYVASAFGGEYFWAEGQAPAVHPIFETTADFLAAEPTPLHQTKIGQHILAMTEYFLDKTHGKLPICLTDVQAPVNMLGYLIPVTQLFMDVADDPELVAKAAMKLANLVGEFLEKQAALIGDCLASPGHGFGSSRAFRGLGISGDNLVMLSPDSYREIFTPADEKFGEAFGGVAFHSCGTWGRYLSTVLSTKGLLQIDGAFSPLTDPAHNPPESFVTSPSVILNARAVGTPKEVLPAFSTLMKQNKKLLAVTYCETPAEQNALYTALHRLAEEK